MITDTKMKEKMQYACSTGCIMNFLRIPADLAMPPVVSVVIVTILYFLFKMTIGDYTLRISTGIHHSGYSLYLIVHYVVHAYQPPKNFPTGSLDQPWYSSL